MRIFGRGTASTPCPPTAYDQMRERIDAALTSVFTEDGKRTVIYYMAQKYGLTLEQASRNPDKLEYALTGLLGGKGWTVVKSRILKEFCDPSLRGDALSSQAASLKDAFGLSSSTLSHIAPFSIRV